MSELTNDKHLDVCLDIELGLKKQYQTNPELTDSVCIFALDAAKIAVKQQFGYAKNERVAATDATRGIIDACVTIGVDRIGKVNELTLKEYLDRIERIKRSVIRHSAYGQRGYFEFIRQHI